MRRLPTTAAQPRRWASKPDPWQFLLSHHSLRPFDQQPVRPRPQDAQPYSIRWPAEVAHPTNKVFPSTLSTRLLTLDMNS